MRTDFFFADDYLWRRYKSELILTDTIADGDDRFDMTGSDWQDRTVMNVRTTRRGLIIKKTDENSDDPFMPRTHCENSTALNPISKKKSVKRKRTRTKKNIKKQHLCPQCPRAYSYSCGLKQHLKYECGKPCKFACPYCNKKTKRLENCNRHIKYQHKGQPVYANKMY